MAGSGNRAKFYVAMCQVYKHVVDENGAPVYERQMYNSMRTDGTQGYYDRVKMVPDEGVFRGFGANGKVISVYDSAAKARRYCGKSGFVMELDPADGIRVGCSPEEALQHCEDRMLFWAKEADRINQELRND